MDISVVVNTYNEAEKLDKCLSTVRGFSDEVIIVDLSSSDNLKNIAAKYQARVIDHPHVPYVEIVRDFSIRQAGSKWVLILDPDEQISKDLAAQLKNIVKENICDAVNIPRKNVIFSSWVRHSNWWPDKQIRFFKKDKIKWPEIIHGYPQISGKILDLPAKENFAIIHDNYHTVSEFLQRQNRYSDVSADYRFRNGEHFSWFNFFWKPTRIFLQRYFRHLGFLDGFLGLSLSFLCFYSQLSEEVKLWEKEQ